MASVKTAAGLSEPAHLVGQRTAPLVADGRRLALRAGAPARDGGEG